MKRAISVIIITAIAFISAGCAGLDIPRQTDSVTSANSNSNVGTDNNTNSNSQDTIQLSSQVTELEKGLSAVRYSGDYGFDGFLSQGGAASDSEVVDFISKKVLSSARGLSFEGVPFGCSTVSAVDAEGNRLFGRNFDWNKCSAMIVHSVPENGYSSISTVNTDFINMSGLKLSDLPDQAQAVICMYAPLDGLNEKGLAVSVNMIEDSDTISQNTDKPDITTTTTIRLLLDRAADADEAVSLLKEYDMHASMGFMMHIAIADSKGKSVVVEYVKNEMIVTETPVVTNFYLAEGEKHGIGTAQSKGRYDILMKTLSENEKMTMENVRDALDSVSKHNFGGSESTEWSIVFNQTTGEVHYYHRENYNTKYTFSIK
ncbi:MAG: linear amide C-N hydrolase [Ruminiclostridium sp.]|nr:linear amide C-N hydrolase [Ruminiclostridium sp.]